VYRKKREKSKPLPLEKRIAYTQAGRALSVGRALQDANLPFSPRNEDWLIAGALLAGAVSNQELADAANISPEDVAAKLQDPAFARWLSLKVEEELPNRLSLVDLAVYSRALKSGDVSRARYLAERFGKMRRQGGGTQHYHLHLSLEKMSEEQLEKLVEEKRRLLGMTIEAEVVEEKTDGDEAEQA